MDVGKIRGLRARLRERSTSRANHIRDRRRQRDPVIGIGNHSLRDEFHLDTLKRPYCSINSDNLRRGPCSVTLVTFFSCLPIVPLPPTVHTHTHTKYIYVLTCVSTPLFAPLLRYLLFWVLLSFVHSLRFIFLATNSRWKISTTIIRFQIQVDLIFGHRVLKLS